MVPIYQIIPFTKRPPYRRGLEYANFQKGNILPKKKERFVYDTSSNEETLVMEL